MSFSRPERPEIFAQVIEGIVEEAIASEQRGRVKCDGTYWPAQLYHSNCKVFLNPDQKVCVVGRIGITLLVTPP